MGLRRLSLRIVGLLVAAIVLMAATQLLLLSFEVLPLFSESSIDSVNGWIRDPPRPGVGILVGVALAAFAGWVLFSFVRSLGTDRRIITTRKRDGWTKLDRASLEAALERDLKAVDRRNDVSVRVNRRGRIDLNLVTPDSSAIGPSMELREVLDEACESRSLPCRSGRMTTTAPRRMNARRQVR